MSRSWFWAGCFAFTLLLAACGGGDDGLTSFTSDDGVVSVEVPPGAAPDDFSATVSLSDPSALGVDTSDVESVILVYELGPDGTEFDEPVTVTFRIPSAIGGFDPAAGLPVSLIVIEDGTGGFEPLGSMKSFLDGDVLVVEGTTTHFSQAVIMLAGVEVFFSLNPPGLMKPVESTFNVSLGLRLTLNGYGIESLFIGRTDFAATGALEVVSVDSKDAATIRCAKKGGGVVEATVFGDLADAIPIATLAQLLTGGSGEFIGSLSLEIECVEGPADTTSTTSTTEPPTGSDPEGDGKNGESEPVTPEEDVPGADIRSVRHERGPSGENCFIIDVYGDGKKTATDGEQPVGNYLIDIEVPGPDGWGTRVEFRQGEPEPGNVRLGAKTSGRDTLEGAEVSVEWVDSDTMKVTVAGTGTDLGVGTFAVDINVFFSGGSFYDHAEGVGAP